MTPELELHAGALMRRAQGGDQPAYDELLRLAARDARGFVARRMGMSEAAVKASAHRGYKLLRRTVGLTDVEHRPAD